MNVHLDELLPPEPAATDHQSGFGAIVRDGAVIVPGIQATTCSTCGAVIARHRFASAAEIHAHYAAYAEHTANGRQAAERGCWPVLASEPAMRSAKARHWLAGYRAAKPAKQAAKLEPSGAGF